MVTLESSKNCLINLQPYTFPHFQIEHGIWDVGQFLRRAGRGKPAPGEKSRKKGREPTINPTSIDAGTIQPGGGGAPHMKVVGMLVVSFRGVNFGFWSRSGCSG